MQTPNTNQLLSKISKDLQSIGTPEQAADTTAPDTQAEVSELREKLAQAEKLSKQSFDVLRKQGHVIRTLKMSSDEKDEQIRQLRESLAQQNATISRLLCLPPNVSDLP